MLSYRRGKKAASIYSIQRGQPAPDAEDIHINPNANIQGLYE